ncbi:MAG TPA: WG repeat-containing protein [Candidatus Polarisedimenticolia bacterium]|nr:WG repeat-containing protein [Candidatus Polarisedimenticolia bacterium]
MKHFFAWLLMVSAVTLVVAQEGQTGATEEPKPTADAETAKPADAGKENGLLYPVLGNRKWGLIDRTGKVVVPKQFDGIDPVQGPPLPSNVNPLLEGVRNLIMSSPLEQDLIAVRVGEKWGYIDRKGEQVIPPKFDAAKSFSGDVGRAAVAGK